MISHAITIVVNELNRHLAAYGAVNAPMVELGNIADGFRNNGGGNGGVAREVLNISVVNIREEKTLKNVTNVVSRDKNAGTALLENPPVVLNLQLMVVATHANYASALQMLSRAIRYFQAVGYLTDTTVAASSLTTNAPVNVLDRLDGFRLIFDLCSPSLEEVNQLWGTLGGKQYPFVLYMMRMLELRFRMPPAETRLVTQTEGRIVQLGGSAL